MRIRLFGRATATVLIGALLSTAVCLPSTTLAEVYKYKDANGNWQFTDKPPQAKSAQKLDEYSAASGQSTKNYRKILLDKYRPQSVVEEATIAVVKIETPLGTGSGFFITESGYLVTNKHVLRPPKFSQADRDGEFKKSEASLERARKRLTTQRSRLKSAKRNLDDYTRYFNNLSESEQNQTRGEFQRRKKNYASNKREIDKYAARIKRDTQKINATRNNYVRRHSNTMISRQFKIILKDDTRLNAELVRLSNKYDLALLKVDGHSMPHISMASAHNVRQGHEVFAIGSPLGNTDYVTAGIITSLKRDQIVFDAQILPGNSGGPLLNADGLVIGVNTWKVLSTRSISSNGFGVAIPVRRVQAEFSDVLGRAQASKSRVTPAGASAEIVEKNRVENNSAEQDSSLRDAILRDYQTGK